MLEVALLCVNLVWIYKLCKHQLYTHCVYLFALCTVSKRPCWLQCLFF